MHLIDEMNIFADLILGKHISLHRKFSALNHLTISSNPQKGCPIAKGFHLLHFPTGWFLWMHTGTYMYMNQAY